MTPEVLVDYPEFPGVLAPACMWMLINGSLVCLGSYYVTYHAVSTTCRVAGQPQTFTIVSIGFSDLNDIYIYLND